MSAPLIGDLCCYVCGPSRAMRMCLACFRSYDRYPRDESSVMGAIIWAARRSRRFAIARERLQNRLATAGLLRGKS